MPGRDNNSQRQPGQPPEMNPQMGQMSPIPNAAALQAMMPMPKPHLVPQLPQPWQGIPTSMPTPQPNFSASLLQMPGMPGIVNAVRAGQGTGQPATATAPAPVYQNVPQTEFGASLQGQIQDYLDTPAGMDPEVYAKQKAEALLGVEQGYAQQKAQLAQQLGARGLGYGGAFLTGSQALVSGEELAKSKAVNDLFYNQEMMKLQDEWKRLEAMLGLHGAEADNAIEMKLAEIAEKIKQEEFKYDKNLAMTDVAMQMLEGGFTPDEVLEFMAKMFPDEYEAQYGEWAPGPPGMLSTEEAIKMGFPHSPMAGEGHTVWDESGPTYWVYTTKDGTTYAWYENA